MARDEFPQQVKEVLALRVNHCCSNPDCRAPTSGPREDVGKSVNVGVAAHISAASLGGPRFSFQMRPEDRRAATNGIWLCQNCAKLVDSDPGRFACQMLFDWKRDAEAEAQQLIGKPSLGATASILTTLHGQLERESNPRFGFSFLHPLIWDREDPTNGDGNRFRHPTAPWIEMSAWGGYAVLSIDLNSWVDRTISAMRDELGFQLISRVSSGGHIFDWEEDRRSRTLVGTRQQVEGYRAVYITVESVCEFTTMQTFIQWGNTQVSIACRAPSDHYKTYEQLFLVISKGLRILGPNSAPFARSEPESAPSGHYPRA